MSKVISTILCVLFFGSGALITLFILGGLAFGLFQKVSAWLIWQFAKSSYEPRTPVQEEKWRKKIRMRRILLYTPPCCFVAIFLPLFMMAIFGYEFNRFWMFVGFGVMFGICWLIDHCLFPVLAEWAKKYRETN